LRCWKKREVCERTIVHFEEKLETGPLAIISSNADVQSAVMVTKGRWERVLRRKKERKMGGRKTIKFLLLLLTTE